MDSALPRSNSGFASATIERVASNSMAFLMLGGASLIIMALLLTLTNRQIVMNDGVRSLLQQATGLTFIGMVLFSYPHFIWSYRFAYQQGGAFITRHKWPLLVFPILLIVSLTLSVATWGYPVAKLPWLLSIDAALNTIGINLFWSSYEGLGQLLIASLLVSQTVMAGYHFCMQAYGVTLACGEDCRYRLNAAQKKILKINLLCLWLMNLLSGYKFFSIFSGNGFVYHPARFPEPLFNVSVLVFAASLCAVIYKIVVPIISKQKRYPPVLAALPVVSVWLWLQPFVQPFGYQGWVVPIAHGAQYLYFAGKVESNSFAPEFAAQCGKSRGLKAVLVLAVGAAVIVIGYLCCLYFPLMLDIAFARKIVTANFFLVASYLFVSLHHYMVDSVVWKNDSRARQLLHSSG